MKKGNLLLYGLLFSCACFGQEVLSLEDCRQMAAEHNKNLKIAQENVEIATLMKKAAFAQFLPSFSANGAYLWNQKNISLLSEDAYLPVGTVMSDGSFGFTAEQINNQWTVVNGNYVPLDSDGVPFDPSVNPEKIDWKNHAILPKEAMEFDIQHIFAGKIGFTQPIYMGGKIRELNKLAQYGENLAGIKLENQATELWVEVDEAYWRVVSVEAKVALAGEYRKLVSKAHDDLEMMMEEGLATRADLLKVKVKLNEADLSLTRAENGLSLSRMALNQLCGIPLEKAYVLADKNTAWQTLAAADVCVEGAFESRYEIMALDQMLNIARSNEKLAYSRFLPNVAMTGGYTISNPNVFNGVSHKFDGMFTVGVGIHIPIYHFGERRYMLKAAKTQTQIASYQMEEAREKIELQITQSSFRMDESLKKLQATRHNISSAEENMRAAEEGFAEGVISATDLLGAQSAWLAAKSDNIDADIDVKLCYLYLQKATGNLNNHK